MSCPGGAGFFLGPDRRVREHRLQISLLHYHTRWWERGIIKTIQITYLNLNRSIWLLDIKCWLKKVNLEFGLWGCVCLWWGEGCISIKIIIIKGILQLSSPSVVYMELLQTRISSSFPVLRKEQKTQFIQSKLDYNGSLRAVVVFYQ